MKGHLARDCRYRGRGAPVETQEGRGRENGRSSANQIATVSTRRMKEIRHIEPRNYRKN